MRGPELEHELIVRTKIDFLHMPALVQIPEMQAPSVFRAQQDLRHQTVLDRIRRPPFARHHRVVAKMPPRVIGETLRPAVDFPAAKHLEAFGVHEEDAARSVARGVAERGDVDAFRPAMHGVRAAIAGPLDDFFGLDHLGDRRASQVGLRVDDVDARGAEARHDEIAPLDVRVGRIGAEARAASIPSIMVQLVAELRHFDLADDRGIAGRAGIDVDDGQRVRHVPLGRECRDIGERLGRRLRCQARRRIKARIGRPSSH